MSERLKSSHEMSCCQASGVRNQTGAFRATSATIASHAQKRQKPCAYSRRSEARDT